MVFEAYASAIEILFQPINLLILLGAVFIGLIIGAIPTVSGLVMLPLLLPFIFRMPAEAALILLISIPAVVFTGGSITTILLNIPGTTPNAATMLDGFPMTLKGEGGRAIGAAVTSSMAGGVIPVFLAIAMIPAIMPIIMAFGQPEMAVLVLVGISFLASLTGRSVTKGLIAGLSGILISFIGYHAITGAHRFSFGTAFLFDGIKMIPLTLGLFGFSELFHLVVKGQTAINQEITGTRLVDVLRGVQDVWRKRWLWLRSTIIGYIIGIIPGLGAEVATWVCYGQAKQTSKYPKKFGTGIVDGVIAPEAANNAKEAGSLLTTMAFGIPGSAVMAILLAAFIVVGVIPGPAMMVDNLPLALTLLLGIALANIIGGIICLLAAPYLVRVASVHLDYLIPAVFVVGFVGIFVATNSALNFIVALTFGLLGFLMKRYGYSRPALLLGFVLGGLFEKHSLLSVKIYGPLFFFRPIPLILIVFIIIILIYPYLKASVLDIRRRFTRA